jgi:hypothetical protein
VGGLFSEFEAIRTVSSEYDAPRRYELLYTPHIANVELWKTSGHFDFYADGMFDQMDVRYLCGHQIAGVPRRRRVCAMAWRFHAIDATLSP